MEIMERKYVYMAVLLFLLGTVTGYVLFDQVWPCIHGMINGYCSIDCVFYQ